jgi:AraC family transcriptional regulator
MDLQIGFDKEINALEISQRHPAHDRNNGTAAIDFRPAEIARRQTARWPGLYAEAVHIISHEMFEYRFKQPYHMLIAAEQAARYDGETRLEGLAPSRLREFSRKLTFVPAGRAFSGWQSPRLLTRAIYVYIDPRMVPIDPTTGFADAVLAPRLFFESRDLWQTMLKLKTLIGNADVGSRLYAEAPTVVLAHELLRLDGGAPTPKSTSRGGLAGWQQKRVASFIDGHLAQNVSLGELAQLAGLSPYHFLRSFKQSFGEPPHRYQVGRRIERAQELLANPRMSVTEIALDVGFATTSAFSATFHRIIGRTPSRYRRDLE